MFSKLQGRKNALRLDVIEKMRNEKCDRFDYVKILNFSLYKKVIKIKWYYQFRFSTNKR